MTANGVFPVKILDFVCLIDDKKDFEKYSFKDLLLAWSRFLKKIIHNCSIPGPMERKHNKPMVKTNVGPVFLLALSH